jgi:hypothetical protein
VPIVAVGYFGGYPKVLGRLKGHSIFQRIFHVKSCGDGNNGHGKTNGEGKNFDGSRRVTRRPSQAESGAQAQPEIGRSC